MVRWEVVLVLIAPLLSAAFASQCQQDASTAYIEAIVSHSQADADAVPLEEDVVRFE